MSRARKGCAFCDVNNKDWDWKKLPVSLGIFGDYCINVFVSGYRKKLTVELEPENSEPIWYEKIDIEYCPFCGTKLEKMKRKDEKEC